MASEETDIDMGELWDPTDAWLSSLIRRLRGWPSDAYVPPEMLREWRRAVWAEMMRHARARHIGRKPDPRIILPSARGRSISAGDIVLELLLSPEGQFWIGVAVSMAAMLTGIATATAEARVAATRAQEAKRRAMVAEAKAVCRYLDSKLGGLPFVYVPAMPPAASYRAAANGVTPRRARQWRARLADPVQALDALAEMHVIGREVSLAVQPLTIWHPEPGPPRGIVPDPPPEPEAPPVSGGVAAGERPAFIAGRGAA
jgi:hypothetical protein